VAHGPRKKSVDFGGSVRITLLYCYG